MNSWVNAPLFDEPVLPDEPVSIALRGSVDRVSFGDGLSIAVPSGWTPEVSDDRVILKRTSAVVVASIDRSASSIDDAAASNVRSAHPRPLRLVDSRPTEGLHRSRQDGVPREVRHVEDSGVEGSSDLRESVRIGGTPARASG